MISRVTSFGLHLLPGPMSPLVDPRILGRLAALPGSEGRNLATELVDVYLEQASRVIGSLPDVAARGDAPLLQRQAHSLRGTALMFGANAFAEQLHRLELAAERGETAAWPAALATVTAEWPATAAALTEATAEWRAAPREG